MDIDEARKIRDDYHENYHARTEQEKRLYELEDEANLLSKIIDKTKSSRSIDYWEIMRIDYRDYYRNLHGPDQTEQFLAKFIERQWLEKKPVFGFWNRSVQHSKFQIAAAAKDGLQELEQKSTSLSKELQELQAAKLEADAVMDQHIKDETPRVTLEMTDEERKVFHLLQEFLNHSTGVSDVIGRLRALGFKEQPPSPSSIVPSSIFIKGSCKIVATKNGSSLQHFAFMTDDSTSPAMLVNEGEYVGWRFN